MGIEDKDKFICLYVRDKKYLKTQFSNNDWSYHDYRNADIDNFMLAAEKLTKIGYFVIRIGSMVEK